MNTSQGEDRRFLLAVAEDKKLWRTSDVVGVLMGLQRSYDGMPWWVRIFMSQWNNALKTAIATFASHAIIQAEGRAKALADDLSNEWTESLE